MQKIASDITIKAVEDGLMQQVELVDGARFRFSSQVTPCYDATVWIWGRSGRPAALLTLSAERRGRESPAINRVSSNELHARLDGDEIWMAPRVADATIRSPYYLFHRPMLTELGDE